MKLIILYLCCILLIGCQAQVASEKDIAIIPVPERVELKSGKFKFPSKMNYYFSDPSFGPLINDLNNLLGREVSMTPSEKNNAQLMILLDPKIDKEGYQLTIDSKNIQIGASTPHGAYYAIQTIRQLLPGEIENKNYGSPVLELPAVSITDSPRFSYRGLMLDVSRYFIPKETVLKIIDAAAMIKINKLHLHLVDDQGWRIEIKRYPKLTEIGAWRVFREEPFPLRSAPKSKEEPTPVGGFYTQEDIREMVDFAQKRHIEIIPEIEMPAHTLSSLASYPELACPVVTDFIPVLPGMGGKNAKAVYCAGNEQTFEFIEHVLDEVIALFPSKFIHIGGDEANKTNWEKCPLCKQRMKNEKITHVEDLQGYFMERVAGYLRKNDKDVIGWDELTNSKIPQDAVIFGWQGYGRAGYKAAEKGHRFVMTPSNTLYLDYYQGPQWFEPRGYFGNNTLSKIYNYEPVQKEWDPEVAKKLLGIQASMWCEFMNTPELVEYMVFPRIAALADIAWAQKDTKNWPGFISRLDSLQKRWQLMGINHSNSSLNLDHHATTQNGCVAVALSCERPDVKIFYTLDGSIPDSNSFIYNDTLKFDREIKIAAVAIKNKNQKGEVLNLDLNWNKATASVIENEHPKINLLVNGITGTDKHTDPEWCGWYDQDISFKIDLGSEKNISEINLGQVMNYGMGVHLPEKVSFEIFDDNDNLIFSDAKVYKQAEIYDRVIERRNLNFKNLNTKGRSIRFNLKSPGKTPDFHHRAGQGTWIFVDEVSVI